MFHTQKTPSILLEAPEGVDGIKTSPQMEKGRMGSSTQRLSAALEKGLKRRAGTCPVELSHRILFLGLNRDLALLRLGNEEVCHLLEEEMVRVGIEIFSTPSSFLLYTQLCSAVDAAMVENKYTKALEALELATTELKWYLKRIIKSWLHLNEVLVRDARERRVWATALGSWDCQPRESTLEAGRCIQLIRTALLWWKRLPLCLPPKEESFEGFVKVERRLRLIDRLYGNYDLRSPEMRERPELSRLVKVVKAVLHYLVPDEELMALETSLIGYVPSGANADAGRGDYTAKFWRLLTEQVRNSSQIPANWKLPGWSETLHSVTKTAAKVVCVPKSFGKQRVIAEQPVTEQVIQNVLTDYLDRKILCVGGRMEAICDRADQTRNREVARIASFSKSHDTIDLSNASDTVAWSLVKRVCSPRLVRFMSVCRSQRARVGSEEIVLHKAFTSGASLCFPTECLIFAAIALATWLLMLYGDNADDVLVASVATWLSEYFAQEAFIIFVFGDDIVCPSWMTSELIKNLRALGFVVNKTKSYTGNSPFRESCGIEAFEGIDITPLRFPRNFAKVEESPVPGQDGKYRLKQQEKQAKAEFLQSMRSLHNSLFVRGYEETCSSLRSIMKQAGWGPWMTFGVTSEQWLSYQPDNGHLPTHRCNRKTCPIGMYCPTLKSGGLVPMKLEFRLHRVMRPEDWFAFMVIRTSVSAADLYVQTWLMAQERCKPSPSLVSRKELGKRHPLLGKPHHYLLAEMLEGGDGWHYRIVAGPKPDAMSAFLPQQPPAEVEPPAETLLGKQVYSISKSPYGCE